MPRRKRMYFEPRLGQGEDAFDRALNRIKGRVEEDGSFRTVGGRRFDAEKNRYLPTKKKK